LGISIDGAQLPEISLDCLRKGRTRPKGAGIIGVEEGVGFSGDDFSVEIYAFEDASKAKHFVKQAGTK